MMIGWKIVLILPAIVVIGSAIIGVASALPSDGFSILPESFQGKIPSPMLSPISLTMPLMPGLSQFPAAGVSPVMPPMQEMVPSPIASSTPWPTPSMPGPVSYSPISGYAPLTPGASPSEAPTPGYIPLTPGPFSSEPPGFPSPAPYEPVPVPIASPPRASPPPSPCASMPAPVSTPSASAPSASPPPYLPSPSPHVQNPALVLTPSVPPPLASLPPFPPSPSPYAPMPTPEPSSSGIKGAYWRSWLAESLPPLEIPTSYFTHLFYAFVQLDTFTFQLSITQSDERWMGNFTAILHAKNPLVKAFLSIGGGASNPDTFSTMVGDPDNRAAFINSTIDVARRYGFDGLDLDWEFPNSPQDMSNLGVLYSEWHAAVKREAHFSGQSKLLLSSAVYFASNFFLSAAPQSYPAHAIKKYVDFINPMCYDYHGSWDTSVTGAHALLYDKTSNVSTSYGIMSWIQAGVPQEKLVMGLPLYGRTWELKDPNKHGIGDPAVGTGPGIDGVMAYTDIVDFNSEKNATEVYDEETVSTYSFAGTDWIGYDGPISTGNKVKFAREQGLGGYFVWALGDDKNWTLSQAGKFMSVLIVFNKL